MQANIGWLCGVVLIGAAAAPAMAQQPQRLSQPALFRQRLADYDAEPRRPDGHVDIEALLGRLKELNVSCYYWLIWHASSDWDDLKLFLPKAAAANIQVWVYLVPPTESPPRYGSRYSEPFRLDYARWAEEIARLSLEQKNLTAWVIDDFYANRAFFTPDRLRDMQTRAKAINPRLAFLPLMYFGEIDEKFAEDYHTVIDGAVVAYLQDRQEIDWVRAVLDDAAAAGPAELNYPWSTPSHAGDFVMASQNAAVQPAQQYMLRFRQRDDFAGATAGYHIKQLLVDDAVVWEEDVAGGPPTWRQVSVDVSRQVRGKAAVRVAFRLLDRKGVSNFGVHWRLDELKAEGLQLSADLRQPDQWQVTRQGAFQTPLGAAPKVARRRFHIPFISMTAANPQEFRMRHGDPATPQRIAEQLRISLDAWREGQCDGVVTYCLDKRPESPSFALVRKLFGEFKARGSSIDPGAAKAAR